MKKCYVCDSKALIKDAARNVKEADCVRCGMYMVSGSLLAEATINKLTFNIEKTCEWLSEQRRLAVSVPLLAATNVYWNESSWPAVCISRSQAPGS